VVFLEASHRKAMTTLKKLLPLLLLLLTACGQASFSAEQAAIQAMRDSQGQGSVYEDTIQVLQTKQVDQYVYVLYAFRTREVNYDADCLWLYRVQRTKVGLWRPSGGGGGCSGVLPGSDPSPMPDVEIGGGQSTNGPLDPGKSETYGKVNRPGIVKVQVTWDDGQSEDVDVVNASYMIVRDGLLKTVKVEGLDEAGAVVFTNEMGGPAPGKTE
jgi:hypothetical protein